MTDTKPPSVFDQIVEVLPPHTCVERALFRHTATWTTPAGTWQLTAQAFDGFSVQGPRLHMNPDPRSPGVASRIIGTLRLHNTIAPAEDDVDNLLIDGWALMATADNWGVRADGWREAAEKWRDRFHAHLGLPKPEPIIDRNIQPRSGERDDEERIAAAEAMAQAYAEAMAQAYLDTLSTTETPGSVMENATDAQKGQS